MSHEVATAENDLTYFILAQLRVICRAIDDLKAYLARKAEEARHTERLLRASAQLNHRQIALLGHALRHPGFRYAIAAHQASHRITYQTARADLLDLAEKRMTHELHIREEMHARNEPVMTDAVKLAVDIGGTFTDVVVEWEGRQESIKVLTTSRAPEDGVLEGVRAVLEKAGLTPEAIGLVIHGTTLAT